MIEREMLETLKTPDDAPARSRRAARSARHRARELVIQGLYEWRVGGRDAAAIEAHLPELEGFEKADQALYLSLFRGVLGQAEALVPLLSPCLDRVFDELSPVEASILLLGAYEFQAHPETPYRVVINEMVELAKSFGGTDGHKFVNGVLDKLGKKLRPLETRSAPQAQP